MNNYKCTNGFTSSSRRKFSYGEKISSYVYHSLPYSEQRNFTMVLEESSGYSSHSSNDFSTPSMNLDFGSSSSSDFSSSSDSGSSTDFGGGSFDGGGAGGDW